MEGTDCATCQNQLGSYYDQQKDLTEAIKCFRKAAAQNLLMSKHNLACKLYEIGQVEEAREWFEQAASENHPGSLYYLGVIYEQQDGDCRSIECFRKSARLGNQKAVEALKSLQLYDS